MGAALSLAGLACGGRTSMGEPPGSNDVPELRGVFVATGSATVRRYLHTATLLPNGRVLVAGGWGDSTGPLYLASVELYDPAAGRFSATGSMAVGRAEHTAARLNNGEVLIAGGFQTDYSFVRGELYAPAAGTFAPTGRLGENVDWRVTTATLLSNGKVLVAGATNDGQDPMTSGRGLYAVVYDPGPGTYEATGKMKVNRVWNTATLLPNGQVLIVGGADFGEETAELYDPDRGTFSGTGSMAAPRFRHTATLLGDGRVLVAGGQYDGDPIASAELFDPATGTFVGTGRMATARSGHTATRLRNGKVLVAGGWAGSHIAASAELYDPDTGAFVAADTMTTARAGHTATLLSDGRVLMVGGTDDSGPLASAEIYE
jgi:hypothetical protein